MIFKPEVQLTYNSYDVTEDFSPYLAEAVYTDYEEEQSDELTVVLIDNDGRFRGNWSLSKGAKLSCTMFSKTGKLNCGTFTIDETEYSGDENGDICTVRAVAASVNKSVRTVTAAGYQSTTLAALAREIGERQGFTVSGDQGNIMIDKITQAQETDLGFLRRVSRMYGYIFKITDNVLTFIAREDLESADPLLIFNKSGLKSWSVTNTSYKQYCACTARYYDPKSKKLKTFTAKNSDSIYKDTLKLSAKYNSQEAAKRAASIGLKNGSAEKTGRIDLKEAASNFIAGVNIELAEDFGIYNGIWHVTKSEHRISSESYGVSGEIKQV